MVSGLQLGVADSSSMPSLPVMKSALLQQNEASGGPSRGNRESAVHILEDTLDDEDLYEAIQRPEVDVSQTKPHGESRYTGRVLRTPDINKPTRNIVESIWMGLAAFIQNQLAQGRSVAIPNFGKFKHITTTKSSKKARKEPVFIWHDYFLEEHGVRARSVPKGLLDPEERELNYAAVAVFGSVAKDTVVGVLRTAFAQIGKFAARTKVQAVRVRIPIYEVGRICCDRGNVKFSFNSKWDTTRPSTSSTCRSLGSRGSLASRGGVLGDVARPVATPSSMQSGMQSALIGLDQSAPHGSISPPKMKKTVTNKHENRSQLAPLPEEVDEKRPQVSKATTSDDKSDFPTAADALREDAEATDLVMPMANADESFLPATAKKISRRSHGRPSSTGNMSEAPMSDLVASVLNDFDDKVQFDAANVEELLERPTTSQSVHSNRSVESVLPVYLAASDRPTGKRRKQRQIAEASMRRAYEAFAETAKTEKMRIQRQNMTIEAEQRRRMVADLTARNRRRQLLMEQRAVHQAQIAEREKFFSADRARQIEGDGGLLSIHHHKDPTFENIIAPIEAKHKRALKAQARSDALTRTLDAAEQKEYELFINDAVARDMANRHEKNRNAKVKQAKELRQEWEAQLAAMEQQRRLSQLDQTEDTDASESESS